MRGHIPELLMNMSMIQDVLQKLEKRKADTTLYPIVLPILKRRHSIRFLE